MVTGAVPGAPCVTATVSACPQLADVPGDGLCCGRNCGWYRVTAGAALVAGTDLSTGPMVTFTTESTLFALWSPVALDSRPATIQESLVCSSIVVSVTPDR
jgi:hypothetical protein